MLLLNIPTKFFQTPFFILVGIGGSWELEQKRLERVSAGTEQLIVALLYQNSLFRYDFFFCGKRYSTVAMDYTTLPHVDTDEFLGLIHDATSWNIGLLCVNSPLSDVFPNKKTIISEYAEVTSGDCIKITPELCHTHLLEMRPRSRT